MSVNPLNYTGDAYIENMLTSFKLIDMKSRFRKLIDEAVDKKASYRESLISLVKTEEEGKAQRRVERMLKDAKFEHPKTLEEYDFSFSNYQHMQKVKELALLQFLQKKVNILFISPPGVGKTHLATGIGIKACEAGKSFAFTNAADLMVRLSKSMESGTLRNDLLRLGKVNLLIIDELGYLKMDKEKESIFFQLIRHRYEKNSLMIKTNLPLGRWDEVFTGQIAATAILDRLLHHCHVISISGESYRVKGNSKEVKG